MVEHVHISPFRGLFLLAYFSKLRFCLFNHYFFSFLFSFMCMGVSPAGMCITCMQHLRQLGEGILSSGIGVTGCCDCPVGAGN